MANQIKGIRKPEIATKDFTITLTDARVEDGKFCFTIPQTNSELKFTIDAEDFQYKVVNNCCDAPDVINEIGISKEGYKLNAKRWKYEVAPKITKVIKFDAPIAENITNPVIITGTFEYTYTLNNFR